MENFSDFIPILIALGVGIYQLIKFLSKKPSPQPKPNRPPSGKGSEEGWEDLLEALGQKAPQKNSPPLPPPVIPRRIEPVQPKVLASPPPIPPRSIPEYIPPIPARKPVPEVPVASQEFYHPTIAEATELKFKTFDFDNAKAASPAASLSLPGLPNAHADRFRKLLANRERLREAIVLSEILNKPVALR